MRRLKNEFLLKMNLKKLFIKLLMMIEIYYFQKGLQGSFMKHKDD